MVRLKDSCSPKQIKHLRCHTLYLNQTMTKAEHNRPIPKLFNNRPSASAAEVFGLLREPIIFFENNIWNFIESEFHA